MMEKRFFLVRLNAVDLLTLSSVVLSSMAVVLVLSRQMWFALSLLYLAMLADALDGMLARRYGLVRDFGRYLDGFMDVLVYLVSPSILLFLNGMAGWPALVLPLFVASGCIRLAVFNEVGNIESGQGELAYLGMPVFWSLFVVASYELLRTLTHWFMVNNLMVLMLLAMSVLMQLRLPFFKFKKLSHILGITLGSAIFFVWLGLKGSMGS